MLLFLCLSNKDTLLFRKKGCGNSTECRGDLLFCSTLLVSTDLDLSNYKFVYSTAIATYYYSQLSFFFLLPPCPTHFFLGRISDLFSAIGLTDLAPLFCCWLFPRIVLLLFFYTVCFLSIAVLYNWLSGFALIGCTGIIVCT